MSDYGLLSRKLTLDVEYQNTPSTFADAKVPVFAVGREQLCKMFGLRGYPKCRIGNVTLDLSYSDFEHANYALMCLGQWRNTDKISMVAIYDVYETLEQVSMHAGFAMELDCENGYPVRYDYEVWQICDDFTLYAEWDRTASVFSLDTIVRCKCEGCGAEFLKPEKSPARYCRICGMRASRDFDSYFARKDGESSIMSEDYLSSLKLFRAYIRENGTKAIVFANPYSLADEVEGVQHLKELREAGELTPDHECLVSDVVKLERCSACGVTLHKPYQFYVGGHGLVCHRCWRWYRLGINVWDEQVLADRLMRAALYDGFDDDPNWQDDGRADDWWDE